MSTAIPNTNTTKHTGSFLDARDLIHYSQTSKAHRAALQDSVEKKLASEKLLKPVFEANPKQVAEFITSSSANKKLILKKTAFKEGHFCEKLNQFVCFAHYHSISSIQAAANCGDNYLLRDLLLHIADNEKLRLEAAQQLQEVLANKADYLASFKALIEAYQNYLNYLAQPHNIERTIRRAEIDRLWENVAECHKRLSCYGLQEFIGEKPFHPLPEFNTPPAPEKRSEWRREVWGHLENGRLISKESRALYKSIQHAARLRSISPSYGSSDSDAQNDLAAFKYLCQVRQAELENIIACLLKPGEPIKLRKTEDKTDDKKDDKKDNETDKESAAKPRS